MAKPRVFVSSPYYDLKHVRSSLDNFIESLGFDSVLSEKGDIAFAPDVALDESCYREAANADIFVLIIGGRYGSAASDETKKPTQQSFEQYDSITKKEYDAAARQDIPIYILIEANVYSEHQTYLRNQGNEDIRYAHVDSVNIFRLIEDILSQPRNNPVHTFERFSNIESWLREQWSGLFRELLHRMSSQQQIATLSSQVETLGAINETLQRYLETIVTKLYPDDAPHLIQSERKRLTELEQLERLKRHRFYDRVIRPSDINAEDFRSALLMTDSVDELADKMIEIGKNGVAGQWIRNYAEIDREPFQDLNDCREVVGKPRFPKYLKEYG